MEYTRFDLIRLNELPDEAYTEEGIVVVNSHGNINTIVEIFKFETAYNYLFTDEDGYSVYEKVKPDYRVVYEHEDDEWITVEITPIEDIKYRLRAVRVTREMYTFRAINKFFSM